jgi:hypothetical protein
MNYIKRLIEERLGYKFKLEEIPPNLRAKIGELEEERNTLQREKYLYENYRREAENGLQKHLRGISEPYDKKISEAHSYLRSENPDWEFFVGSFLWFCFGIFVLWVVSAAYGAPPHVSFLIVWFLAWFLPFLGSLLHILWKLAKRDMIKEEMANLEKEREEALRRGMDEYRLKVLPELERLVQAQERRVELLEEKFERDLSQLCSEINLTLGIIFQGRMDFGLLRSIMKSRGIVIEKIECPYCGGPMRLPETGHVTKCPYCSRDVYVADIFKELERRFLSYIS